MPSSLARVLSRALVFSTSLPVSVYGTDTIGTPREAFLGSLDSIGLWRSSASSTSLGLKNLRLFLQVQPTDLNPLPDLGRPILLRHSTLHSCPWWCRNIDLLAIAYAFRPRLRFRLTLGGRALPRKPYSYGEEDSHFLYHYSSQDSHYCTLHFQSPSSFAANSMLFYRVYKYTPIASVDNLAPVIFGAESLDQ